MYRPCLRSCDAILSLISSFSFNLRVLYASRMFLFVSYLVSRRTSVGGFGLFDPETFRVKTNGSGTMLSCAERFILYVFDLFALGTIKLANPCFRSTSCLSASAPDLKSSGNISSVNFVSLSLNPVARTSTWSPLLAETSCSSPMEDK